ncbi:MAG: hypothetical protein ISR85_01210 [Kiritimatiellales bacterium]|nr:hypothetical protein [Kiritimatiellota bacterium]MBL7011531.1 hypothetical protein [Kiritimatiellales bacterium]
MRIFKTILFILSLLVGGLLVLQLVSVRDIAPSPEEVPGFIPREFPTNMLPTGGGLFSNSVSFTNTAPESSATALISNSEDANIQRIERVITLEDIPDGEFRNQVQRLPADIQKDVLDKIRRAPQLLNDIESIRVDAQGMIYYVCKLEKESIASGAEPSLGTSTFLSSSPIFDAPVPVSFPPVFHSRAGSARVLFLDFNGHDVSGTAWNVNTNYAMPDTWYCYPYDTDDDYTEFSVAEQQIIYETWLRVSEDYASFDVDVTTEQPAAWSKYTGHALITGTIDTNGIACPHDGYAGIAYLDVFGLNNYSYNSPHACYSPAWILDYGNAADIAEVISHELGHNLGLSHDGLTDAGGTTIDGYYDGHQNGSMSWGAIMGTAYDENVSQWSKGEYYRANNTNEDDLVVISGKLGYIADDYGDSAGTAFSLVLDSNSTFSVTGRVEQTDDPDVFSLVVSSNCLLEVDARTLRLNTDNTRGANLDVLLELRDAADALIVSNNYELEVSARIVTELSPGTYYLHLLPTGVGSPLSSPPTGYTSYGSLGQYVLNGSLGAVDVDPSVEPPVTASFESGFDGWAQSASDDMNWTRDSYTPITETGPADGADSTYFLFTEANGNYCHRIAEIERVFDFSRFQSASLEFKYHMYGVDMGSLSVDVYDGMWHDNVWKRIGEQHTSETEAWSDATVDLGAFAGKTGVKVRFRGIVGAYAWSDMAIDSVSITGVLEPDVDLDGLPNDWELLYFGGETNANPDAVASNGVNTVMEAYIAGINPTNPASFFEASLTNETGFVVQWNATSGRVYSVFGTTNLLESFQPLETNILWPQSSWTDTVNRSESFYQVDVKLAD